MLKIEMEQYDEIMRVSRELEILIYLQGVSAYDVNETGFFEEKLKFAIRDTEIYLWQKQVETLLLLRQMLERIEVN